MAAPQAKTNPDVDPKIAAPQAKTNPDPKAKAETKHKIPEKTKPDEAKPSEQKPAKIAKIEEKTVPSGQGEVEMPK